MPVLAKIVALHDQMRAWRHELHARPETAFQEHWTSQYVADKLASFGIEVARGLAGTGVVGTIKRGEGPAIGLRADMDALDVSEANTFAHASKHSGKMHACGHDGHTAMLLGAAHYLAHSGKFDGTVHLIFQPAEENEGGGRRMIEDGLFERFPVEAVYGMHNWPGLDAGRMAMRPGPVMAAYDVFEIKVRGRGCHGAMPHLGVDAPLAAGHIIVALQSIVSRNTHPLDAAVVSVTQMHGGDTWNVIPEEVVLRGTARCFKPTTRDMIEAAIHRVATGCAAAHGATAEVRYERRYPPTINHAGPTEIAAMAAGEVVGAGNVDLDLVPTMGSEDFAFMLEQRPGCYAFIGNGTAEAGRVLHSPQYDFNDAILPIGASYWVSLTERVLRVPPNDEL